jgi:hypothetical protein
VAIGKLAEVERGGLGGRSGSGWFRGIVFICVNLRLDFVFPLPLGLRFFFGFLGLLSGNAGKHGIYSSVIQVGVQGFVFGVLHHEEVAMDWVGRARLEFFADPGSRAVCLWTSRFVRAGYPKWI